MLSKQALAVPIVVHLLVCESDLPVAAGGAILVKELTALAAL